MKTKKSDEGDKATEKKPTFERVFDVIDRVLNVVTVLGFGLMIFVGAYAIYDSYQVYDGATLGEEILEFKPTGEEFRLTDLQEINPDIVAWVKVEGTHIDYPVLFGKDNTEYLNLDYKGEYATAGSIFLDYRNDRTFENDYSIIYGHNMRADLMFSDIKRFENTAFFNTHRNGTLWTSDGIYNLKFMFYAKFNAFNNSVYNLITYKNGRNEELMKIFREFAVNMASGEHDKLLLLSTCNTAGSNDRAVLLAHMELVEHDETIGDESDFDRLEREKQILSGNETVAVQTDDKIEHTSWFTGLAAWFGGWTIREVLLIALTAVVIVIFLVLIITRVKTMMKKGDAKRDVAKEARVKKDSAKKDVEKETKTKKSTTRKSNKKK